MIIKNANGRRNNKMDNNRLNAKDLINVGIYTAICAVICCIVAMTGIIPIMMVLLVVFVPILTGIPYMLFLTKVKKFGMILILNILMGDFRQVEQVLRRHTGTARSSSSR